MKHKISRNVVSLVLTLVLLITSVPFATWSVIASTISESTVAASADSVATVAENTIEVNYPVTVDGYNYNFSDYQHPSWTLTAEEKTQCDSFISIGLFDPVCYLQLNSDLKQQDVFMNADGNNIDYYAYSLYKHYIQYGVKEGRIASPLFCIGCYCNNNADLLNAFANNSNQYESAWNHLIGALDSTEDRVYSPFLNTKIARENNAELSGFTNRQIIEHAHNYGAREAHDIRMYSDRFDAVSYYFNNNSLYHTEDGILQCYRKAIYDMTDMLKGMQNTADDGAYLHKDYGCYYHGFDSYKGDAVLDDTFSGTLTNIATRKNLSVNGTAVTSVNSGNTSDELWQFTKQTDGTYYIETAPLDSNLSYNDSEEKKYLTASSDGTIGISSSPAKWHIYRNDGFYVLRPDSDYKKVLNIADDGTVSTTLFNNATSSSTAYNTNTLNQCFVINTTYETVADSDGLSAEFYACIDSYMNGGWNSKVALTLGDNILRTRDIVTNGTPAADQIWHFVRQTDGTYTIKNTANGLYMDASPSGVIITGLGHYATDTKEKNTADNNQKWVLRKRNDGGYFIMPYGNAAVYDNGTYLITANQNESVGQWLLYNGGFNASAHSVFDLTFLQTQSDSYNLNANGSNPDSDYFYAYITSAKDGYAGYYLKNNETQYDVEKKFVDASDEDTKKHDFYWAFNRRGDGSYVIYSTTTKDACLMYKDGKVTLSEFDMSVATDTTWFVYKYNGGYRLQHRSTGKFLQMDANGNLTLAEKNTNNYNDFQLFNIKETDMSISTSAETFKINLFNYGTRINNTIDSTYVLDFFSGPNNALDKRNVSIGSADGVLPEMSKVLKNNYPYVNKYAYINSDASGIDGAENYEKPVGENLTPNYFRFGSLQYLFDATKGFDNGGNSALTQYNPVAQDGDEYQSQSFKVDNPSGLFVKDSQGYYVYDSSKNSAYFEINENQKSDTGVLSGSFKVYDYLTHPQGVVPYENSNYQGMFLPFNLAHEQGTLCYGTGLDGDDSDINYNNKETCDIDKANYTMSKLERVIDSTNYTQAIVSGERDKAMDMWFGMTLETDFFQTKDGMLNGQPVKFEFSGDDDVWVYLDGVLALDIGNTHGKITGEINFADSTVTGPVKTTYVNSFADTYGIAESVTYPDGTSASMWLMENDEYVYETVSLYSVYYAAYQEVLGTEQEEKIEATIRRSFGITDATLPTPAANYADDPEYVDFEQHNLKFYYLERGSAAANCKIKLNTFSGGTTVSKQVTGLNEEIMEKTEYQFKVVTVDENGVETPIANSPYTVSSMMTTFASGDEFVSMSDITTDENGLFTLKANQKATFGQISPGSKIKVYELTEDSSITTNWNTYIFENDAVIENSGSGNVTDVILTPLDSTLDIEFTNDYEPSQNVTIRKDFDSTNNGENYAPDENQIYVFGYQLIDKEGKVLVTSSVTLHNGEEVTIKDIPVGYSYRVWEYTPQGALHFESPVFTVNGGSETVKTFVPQGSITPGTNTYVEGIAKQNADDTVVVRNKLIKHGNITVTFKYYDRKRTNGAPAQINDYYSTYTVELTPEQWEVYLNSATQRINFSRLIADQGVVFNNEVAVDNIVDEYVIWTSQAEATGNNGLKKQVNYFAGKNADGTYKTYGDVYDESQLHSHTDAYGNICNCGEKWVTYYKGGSIIDPETQGNDTEVSAITVWLHNRPKQYKAQLYTVDPADLSTSIVTDEFIIGNNEITFEAFYNQRIGSVSDSGDTSDEYLGCYKITDVDVLKGKDNFGQTYSYINMPQTVVDDSDENLPYTFLYWSYDMDGRFIASTSIEYAYRITNNIKLYAVYGKSEMTIPGLTAFRNSVDTYIDSDGVVKVRLNTMMNPYNCTDSDETITDAAIVYVMLHGADKYKDYTEDQLMLELLKTDENGVTNLDKLREQIRRNLVANKTKGSVTFIDVTVSTNGFMYEVETCEGTTSKLNLTSKNRIQFTTEFSKSTLQGRRMLAFTAMKKSESWIVSDNFVDYHDFYFTE